MHMYTYVRLKLNANAFQKMYPLLINSVLSCHTHHHPLLMEDTFCEGTHLQMSFNCELKSCVVNYRYYNIYFRNRNPFGPFGHGTQRAYTHTSPSMSPPNVNHLRLCYSVVHAAPDTSHKYYDCHGMKAAAKVCSHCGECMCHPTTTTTITTSCT